MLDQDEGLRFTTTPLRRRGLARATATGLTTLAASLVLFSTGARAEEPAAATTEAAPAVAAAPAEDTGPQFPGKFAGNVALISDYVFRGVSQTQEEPALQGGIDWSHESGAYFGTWGSNVKFPGDNSYLEQDIYGGWATTVGDLSINLGAIFFWYPNAETALNYWEFPVKLGYTMDAVTLSAGILYSPDYFGFAGNAMYANLGVAYAMPLPDESPVGVTLDAGVGFTVAEDDVITDGTYVDWGVGAKISAKGTWTNLAVTLRYTDTDIHGDDSDARFVYGVAYAF